MPWDWKKLYCKNRSFAVFTYFLLNFFNIYFYNSLVFASNSSQVYCYRVQKGKKKKKSFVHMWLHGHMVNGVKLWWSCILNQGRRYLCFIISIIIQNTSDLLSHDHLSYLICPNLWYEPKKCTMLTTSLELVSILAPKMTAHLTSAVFSL